MDKAKQKNVKIHLPIDFVTGDKFAENATVGAADLKTGIPDGHLVSILIGGFITFVSKRVSMSVRNRVVYSPTLLHAQKQSYGTDRRAFSNGITLQMAQKR